MMTTVPTKRLPASGWFGGTNVRISPLCSTISVSDLPVPMKAAAPERQSSELQIRMMKCRVSMSERASLATAAVIVFGLMSI